LHHLKLLGGASLEGPDGPVTGRAVQRRRLALLALLASAQGRGRGVGREKLLAYLWPEAEAERGRHLLSDSVYRINQAIGADAVIATGDELRIDGDILTSDVAEFEQAVTAGDRERAVALYPGPLLDGVFLADCAEFERWLDGERARLGRAYAAALDGLAQAAEARGATEEAIAWWQRLAAHDPFSSRVVLRLMQALAATGDSASALRRAAAHAEFLRAELGVQPNAAVVELADRIRAESPPQTPATARTPASSPGTTADGATPTVPPGSEPNEATSARSIPHPASRPRRVGWIAVLLGVAAIAIVAVVALTRGNRQRPTPAASIAVLPFVDISGERDNAYFSDGMTEELINTLTKVDGLQVAARTSVFAYRNGNADVREVGRRLGVATVLEGSVRKAGGRIRITAQLANASDGYQLWSETYDRELDDVFAIQREISGAIVRTLRGRLGATSPVVIAERSTANAEAYDLYLKGRYAWHQRSEDGLLRAVEFFTLAVARAPEYARAYVGLGDAYAVLGFYDYLAPRESFPRAEQAARQALAIDSMLAAPYATLGYVALYHGWDWKASEKYFQRSIALDPSYSTAHQWYANLLTATGRFQEAEREMRVAQERDPLSLIANAALGWVFYYAGDLDRAIAQCDRTLELSRDFELAHLWKGWALEASGRRTEAIASIEEAVRLSHGATLPVLSLAHALASSGAHDSARRVLAGVEAKAAGRYLPSYETAKVHLALGDRNAALRWLERAFEERSHSMAFLRVDPQLAPLRADPRFVRLVSRVNDHQ
jgi:TolB-like protein/DNA-binding SARP family transcriptional activator/Tfp pilus assembly protein PilF